MEAAIYPLMNNQQIKQLARNVANEIAMKRYLTMNTINPNPSDLWWVTDSLAKDRSEDVVIVTTPGGDALACCNRFGWFRV